MGVVYRAHDPDIGRDVAVKVLDERLAANPAAVGRFLEEARITGQLQHPGIPAVHEIGRLPDGRPFLAMKLIKGRTLADLLADPAAAYAAYIPTFEAICQAVAYAHAHKVIHRDLKPATVMVGGSRPSSCRQVPTRSTRRPRRAPCSVPRRTCRPSRRSGPWT
jgi:serine/threonine protein kinase